jgi:hypothetical protein
VKSHSLQAGCPGPGVPQAGKLCFTVVCMNFSAPGQGTPAYNETFHTLSKARVTKMPVDLAAHGLLEC